MNIYTKPCRRIWGGYKIYAECCAIPRSGYRLTGMCVDVEELARGSLQIPPERKITLGDIFRIRGESILEHQAKVGWLVAAFASNFKNYFGDTNAPEAAHRLVSCLATTGLTHDVGEVKTGDIPDDGNKLHGTKDDAEREVFTEMTTAFEQPDVNIMLGVYYAFQQKKETYGKGLYVLDKIEAVLTLLLMESYGVESRIDLKPEVTLMDRYYMEQTGSNKAADVWGAHAISEIKDFPPKIIEPALTLLDTAVYDSRGEGFTWRSKNIEPWRPEMAT